jgi:hypothetical protein
MLLACIAGLILFNFRQCFSWGKLFLIHCFNVTSYNQGKPLCGFSAGAGAKSRVNFILLKSHIFLRVFSGETTLAEGGLCLTYWFFGSLLKMLNFVAIC